MLFNSLHFLLFFAIVFPIYFALPHRARWAWLLAASYYFYMCWRVQYTLILIVTTLIDYFAGIGMEQAKTAAARKAYLAFSLAGNLGILFAFKYFDFAAASANSVFYQFNFLTRFPVYHWLLPVGISFHTFQSLSYTFDVYHGVQKAERHLGIFALYVVFFPQLVAGPIERPEHVLPQYRREARLDPERITAGLRMVLWGFFKKLVIADRLAVFVNLVYGDVHRFAGGPSVLATWFFAIQIYCDFSGYSDIALGTARMMGIDLMTNFRFPYLSRSIPEFWRRWHISLSTWFRDYVYLPLGGSRVSPGRWVANVMAVFVLSGLWHGAAWTFLIWGGIHGLAYLGSRLKVWAADRLSLSALFDHPGPLRQALQIFITFQIAAVAWVFFRAGSLSDAIYLLSHLHAPGRWIVSYDTWTATDLFVGFALIAFLFTVEWMQSREILQRFRSDAFRPVRWAAYYALFFAILTLGDAGSRQFIYFQF